MKVIEFKDEDVSNSLLLIGFPSRGFVGTIAANYVVEQLRLRPFAGLYGDELPPTTIGRDGYAYSPVRFYTGAARCGPDGKCDKVVVIVSDIPLDPDILPMAARAIVEWSKENGVALTVVLEGVDAPSSRGKGKKPPAAKIYGLRSLASKQDLKAFHVEPVADAALSSHAAALLLAANQSGVDAVALFADARADLPDARASGALLRKVDPMLPQIPLKAEILEKSAEAMEKVLEASLKDSRTQLRALKKTSEMMYG
jgi:predicted ATP-grasp superfamily ATP-dependent carboligase